jgi:import inner membrane translocase subunit TIM50
MMASAGYGFVRRLVLLSSRSNSRHVQPLLYPSRSTAWRLASLKFYHVTAPLYDEKKPLGLTDQIMAAKLAESKAEDKSQQESGGEKDGSEDKKKETPKWQKYGYSIFAASTIGLSIGYGILFSLPDKDVQGNIIEDEFSKLSFPNQHYSRLKSKIFFAKKAIEDPFSDKLLPDPLEAPYFQPKYTVVLEITGLLVKSDWSHKHGWRFQKRPGLDIFLNQLAYPNFEVVIWSTDSGMTFYPIVRGMDPNGNLIMYQLFKDATKFKNGAHIKELNCLNRDLRRVIVVDWNKLSVQDNPDNALLMPKWNGDMEDRSLFGLAQLLQAIQESDTDDVREILQFYRQYDDPIDAFREKQRQMEETTRLDEELKTREIESTKVSSSFRGFSSFSRFRR